MPRVLAILLLAALCAVPCALRAAPPSPGGQASALAPMFARLARAGSDEARLAFELAVRARPEDAEARAGLAIALVLAGREADAGYHLQRAVESASPIPAVRLARGLALGVAPGQAGSAGAAEAAYQFNRAVEEGADPALALLCRAAVAGARRDFAAGQRAMAEYDALVPKAGQAETAPRLADRVSREEAMVGSYFLDQGAKGGSTAGLYLGLLRKNGALTGAGALALRRAGMARASGFIFQAGSVTFVLEVDQVFHRLYYWRFTLDTSGGFDLMPVLKIERADAREGPWRPADADEFTPPARALVRVPPKAQ